MIELVVRNSQGGEVGQVAVDEARLGGAVNRKLLREAIVMYQANKRVGAHDTKSRSRVAGSGHKLYRQKGTGYARVGNRRNPTRTGGGVAHGPHPRDYSYRLPGKAVKKAAMNALLSKMQDGCVYVVESISLPEAKTKAVAGLLKTLGLKARTLVVTPEHDAVVSRCGRNIPGVTVRKAQEATAYDYLVASSVLITREALEKLSLI